MNLNVLILAWVWPFANAWMLLWALAAAIPIIIHLWHRRRHNEVVWAAMEYLLAALRKNSRRLTIEQLVLLAVRVSILLLLALALADPIRSFLPLLGDGLVAGGQTHWVLVIDGSYSMDYRRSGKSRFETAKALAVQLVEESTQGDGFTLLLMSDPPEVIVRQPAFARADVIEEITSLTLPHGGANLSATLAEAEKMVQTAAERQTRLVCHKVCFFTDMGKTTWEEVESPTGRSRVNRLAEQATLVLFELGGTDQQNLAVTRLVADESLVTAGRDVMLQATIQNFGDRELRGVRVQWLVDRQTTHEERIDVPINGQSSVSHVHRFAAPGEHEVQVQLEDDPLGVDNHRWLSLPVREAIATLCVAGKPRAADYVALALQPTRTDRPRVRATVATENAMLELDLHPFDCVLLCNVAQFTRDEAAALYEYLKNGGGLIFFLGDLVQASGYNDELGGELSGMRVVPARLENVVAEAQYRFDPLEYRHPIVAPFRGHEDAGLLTTPVWRYFKLQPYDRATAKIALAFEGGDPAIIEEQILRGRSVIYAGAVSDASVDRSTSPPTPWTAIHAWPSFPPLVQEMLLLAAGGKALGRNVQVGDDLEGVVYGTVAEIPLTITTPQAQRERLMMRVDGGNRRWMYAETRQSGIYQASFGSPLDETQLYAVNLNTRESNLDRFDPELLPGQFRQELSADAAEAPIRIGGTPSQLFQYVLLGLLLLLFCESFLAWHFGRAWD